MKRLSLLALGLLILLFAAITPTKAGACVCITPRPPCEAFWKAEAVFVGTVTAMSPPPPGMLDYSGDEVQLKVEESFRGDVGETVTIYADGSDCAYRSFVTGKRFLVYAYENKGGHFETGICSRTHELDRSTSEDLVYIRGIRNRPLGSWVYGAMADGKAKKLAPGAEVVLEGKEGRRVTRTDSEGKYQFLGLPPGRYRISAETDEPVWREVEVHDKGCAEVSLPLWYFRHLWLFGEP